MNKDDILWERPNAVELERKTARLKAFEEMARVLQSSRISQAGTDLIHYGERELIGSVSRTAEIICEE